MQTKAPKWTRNQLTTFRMIAAFKERPTVEILKIYFTHFGVKKLNDALNKCLSIRKEFEEVAGLAENSRSLYGEGYIYLLIHPLFSGWVKCGMAKDLKKRLSVYNTGDPLKRFSFLCHKKVKCRKTSENTLIKIFFNVSDEKSEEWFKVDLNKAKDLFNMV